MRLFILLPIISIVWFFSEVIMARIKYSSSEGERTPDRRSLRILWCTIIPAVTLGVILGLRGIGYISIASSLALPAGILFIIFGLIIRWMAVFALRGYFTSNVSILPNHQLVTHGIYRLVRHPAYAGSLLSFLGLGLAFSNWLSVLVIFLPILAAFLYRIRVEEAALREAFGQAYQRYCQKTRRLLPGVY